MIMSNIHTPFAKKFVKYGISGAIFEFVLRSIRASCQYEKVEIIEHHFEIPNSSICILLIFFML